MDSAKAPCTPHGKGGGNPLFREDKFQACSTPCAQSSNKFLFVDANLSSVMEENEDSSVSEGFSKSDNVTIVNVSEYDNETPSKVPEQQGLQLFMKSELNADICMKLCNNTDRTKSEQFVGEMNNNYIAIKQEAKCLNFEENYTDLKTDKVCNNINGVITNPPANQSQEAVEYSPKNDIVDDLKIPSKRVNICSRDNVELVPNDLQSSQGNITITSDLILPVIVDKVDSTNVASTEEKVSSENIELIRYDKGVAAPVDDALNESLTIKTTKALDGISSANNNVLKIQYRITVAAETSVSSKKDTISQNCVTKLPTPLQPSANTNVNEDKNRFDKFDTEEVNVTVTEEDVYFSKRDEISICFDTKPDTFITIDETNCDSVLNDKSVKSIENLKVRAPKVSEILSKRSEEVVVPPPAKKPCLAIEEPTYRHLEDFVSNNAHENVDNNDPQWKKYEQLTSDELRYERVREIWRNSEIPNTNKNLTTYNWRARNNLPPIRYFKNIVRTYFSSVGGDVSDVLSKARDNAKYLYEQKVIALEFKRNKLCEDAEEKLHYSLSRTDRSWRHHFYNEYRSELDGIWADYNTQFEALLAGLEERIYALNKAEEEVRIVSNFYKGLGADDSRSRLSSQQLNCWFDREDILNKYEIFYS